MNIHPSAAIRQNDGKIAELYRQTAESAFFTKNGGGIWALWILKSMIEGRRS